MQFICLVDRVDCEILMRALQSVWSYNFVVKVPSAGGKYAIHVTSNSANQINQSGLTVITAYCNGFKAARKTESGPRPDRHIRRNSDA